LPQEGRDIDVFLKWLLSVGFGFFVSGLKMVHNPHISREKGKGK